MRIGIIGVRSSEVFRRAYILVDTLFEKNVFSAIFFYLIKGYVTKRVTWPHDTIHSNALNSMLNWEFQNA